MGRLGHGQSWREHSAVRPRWVKRRLGKCCMCAVQVETWEHALSCPVRVKWTKELLCETDLCDRYSGSSLRQASTLEAKHMDIWHMEVMSKLWCAWYDMWKAWSGRKVRSKEQMKHLWKQRWRSRLKRAIWVDKRRNEQKAKKKGNIFCQKDGNWDYNSRE